MYILSHAHALEALKGLLDGAQLPGCNLHAAHWSSVGVVKPGGKAFSGSCALHAVAASVAKTAEGVLLVDPDAAEEEARPIIPLQGHFAYSESKTAVAVTGESGQ